MSTGHVVLIVIGTIVGLVAGAALLLWTFGKIVESMWGRK